MRTIKRISTAVIRSAIVAPLFAMGLAFLMLKQYEVSAGVTLTAIWILEKIDGEDECEK